MMKKAILPLRPCALLVSCFIAGLAQAQTISITGDSTPAGEMGASYDTARIIVGNTSAGALDVRGGGKLTSTDVFLGQAPGGNGTTTVDGSGSSWVINAPFDVGLVIGQGQGSGSLKITNGASVTNNKSLTASNSPESIALIEVAGTNSALTSNGRCLWGRSDTTTVQITNGGVVQCGQNGSIGFGSVTLAGTGSKWVMGTDLYMAGATDMHPTLNIGEGSVVEIGGTMELPSFADGTTPTSATVNIEGSTTPGALAAASLLFGPNEAGVLNFNHSDTSGNYQFATPMTGPGKVYVLNGGTTTLTGNNSYAGGTSVTEGTLRAGSATALSSATAFSIGTNGTLDTGSFSPTLSSLHHGGTVTMLAGGTSSTLTVSGEYYGHLGSMALNTVLGDSSAASQKLIVNGNAMGLTTLNITNLGGAGAQTTGNGILVVQVAGTSFGNFELPEPGYIEAGGFRYSLAKVGNNWYLQSEEQLEAAAPAASVACDPSELNGADTLVATCKVSLSVAATADLPINLTLPATHPRYTTTCSSPITVPANATEASCTITAVASEGANGADVTAVLAIAPPTVADAYTITGPAAEVVIKAVEGREGGGGDNGGGDNGGGAVPHKVPTMGAAGLMAMASILSLLGLRRVRKDRTAV
ncbi:autotransporter outer membrane beta-barrel domain-containing protein [Comamonas sp.]|uniref:autotransporter outer membrane beta-barrel domain-containing protein n=1 Tax=Comamonas sp. TaxID=34028 RepID=UPI0028A22BDE|nr:autotransporter outer membrane beta-barrel domain-containing protein [Comamonas sp.]